MRRDLHVLMTTDTVGGVFTYACELMEAMRPHGMTFTLATMGAPLRATQARTLAAMPNVEVFEAGYALEWMTDPWRDIDIAGDWLMALAQLVRPHLVHLNGYAHAALPFDLPVVVVAHSCVCSWHRAVRGKDAGPEWNEYRRRASAGLRAATMTVAPTAAILGDIQRALGVDVPSRVIPNGRVLDVPSLPKESFILGAGRLWDEAKGLDTLQACAHYLGWPIRVAGPLDQPGVVTKARPRSPSNVEALGELEPKQLAWWMARASIYVHPAVYEPFGLAPVEAALAGCALVLSDLPSLREVWGDAALYARPRDVGAFVAAIDSLTSDALRRNALAAKARARARSFTPARMAAGYHALYTELTRSVREVCA
jgi:glycogen(starch) synthase